ncbi:hypothetical protein ACRALDRAFT_1064568 [Sodiomyces alcalophilus JCM 7366]|uniref:uncharacterized protein n=1 Tax=Sodiomyces alcalophilus JCM 7366 TaxID=591952 RepID=UPI0039B54AF3
MFDGISRKSALVKESSSPPKQCSTQDRSPAVASSQGGTSTQINLGNTPSSFPTTEHDSHNTELPISLDQDMRTKAEEDSPSVAAGTTSIEHEAFYVDHSHLKTLFPGLESKVTGSDVEIPDHIITDSFESVSERKTWYRISRFGPSRKHDLGEDDHFTLITWPTSTVRPETIRIVRRWMEEDSIFGRSFRGSLANGASGRSFGWGQKASPVDFQKFFSQRKSMLGGPPTSQSTLPADGPHSLHDTHSLDQSPATVPTSTVGTDAPSSATFSWATRSSPPYPHGTAPSELSAIHRKGDRDFPSPHALDPPPNMIGPTEVEDDEWGDMVTPATIDPSSSPITNHPGLASRGYSEDIPNDHGHTRGVDSPVSVTNSPSRTDNIDQLGRAITQHTPQRTESHTKPTSGHRDVELTGETTHSSQPMSTHMEPSPQFLAEPPAECTSELESARRIVASLPDLSYMLQ